MMLFMPVWCKKGFLLISFNFSFLFKAVENEARLARGEPPISIEEIKKQIKQPQMQTKNGMLDLFLGALDANAYASFQIAVNFK